MEERREALEERVLADLTEEERAHLISALRKVCQAAEGLQSRS
ncbi:hypothetical protein GCM10029964_044810 [Kibdelosporangium lantanae]